MQKLRPMAAALASVAALSSAAQAVVVDTFTRADGTAVAQSVGVSEAGGFAYVERGNTPAAAIVNGTADVTGSALRITGNTGSLVGGSGGVFLSGYSAADTTVTSSLRFVHSIAAPQRTASPAPPGIEELANTFLLMLRSGPAANFGNSAADIGLIGVEIGANGDLLVREVRGAGTLTTVTPNAGGFGNPFTGAAVNRRRLNDGQLPATFNGLPFDVDQDGFIDDGETFTFAAALSGTTLALSVNGQQVNTYTVANTAGLAGNGVGLHKNIISSAFETKDDVYVDNLDLSPVPEPTTLAAIGLAGLAIARRRRA